MLFFLEQKCASNCCEETRIENNHFFLFLIDTAFKGTVVNRASPSLPGGSLEITFTIPLSGGGGRRRGREERERMRGGRVGGGRRGRGRG